jgi:hypothetical protein
MFCVRLCAVGTRRAALSLVSATSYAGDPVPFARELVYDEALAQLGSGFEGGPHEHLIEA